MGVPRPLQTAHLAEGVGMAVRMILDVNLPRRLEVGPGFRGVAPPEALQAHWYIHD